MQISTQNTAQSFGQSGQMVECSVKNLLGSSPVTITSPSDFVPSCSKEFLDIQENIEYGFTLNCVRDMTRTSSQIYRTYKYSEHSLILWSVRPNG